MRTLLTAISSINGNRRGAMKKLFGLFLFLLALAFLAPDLAQAATKTWTGGTGTWDSTTGTHWSGGTAPVNGDAIVFDGTSGGGTVTADSSISGMSFVSITAGAFTGTLDFSVNNPSFTITGAPGASWTGIGARTINMGSGTWTFTGVGITLDISTATNCTSCVFSNAVLVVSANTAGQRTFNAGSQTFGSLTISSNSTKAPFLLGGATPTFASITVGSGNAVSLTQLIRLQ